MKQETYFLPKPSFSGTFFIIPFSPKVFCLFSLVIFLLSCSSPTEENNVTFRGKVTLLAPSGADTSDYFPTETSGFRFSSTGVTVSLYKPVELDTALVRINKEYPNIGVPRKGPLTGQISQETEFDHREHTPLYTTTT